MSNVQTRKRSRRSAQDPDHGVSRERTTSQPPPLRFFSESKSESTPDSATPLDILHHTSVETLPNDDLKHLLSCAFSGMDTGRRIRNAAQTAAIAPSHLDPDCFADSLFVPELLDSCMRVTLDSLKPDLDTAFLIRLLTHPPAHLPTVLFRQDLLRELDETPAVRIAFQQTYIELYRFRERFESDIRSWEHDDRQRRIDILRSLSDVLTALPARFDGCHSGLHRIARFAQNCHNHEGFIRLRSLLDFNNHLAGVQLNVRIGGSGRISRFEVITITENQNNPFYQSPLRRWFTRMQMLFRGYLFSEGELVNRFVDSVFDSVSTLIPPLIRLLGEMEFYLCALSFADKTRSSGLDVAFPEFIDPDNTDDLTIHLKRLFNPLLFRQDITPIPCDLSDSRWDTSTIVTGPNSGGKTRLLQAVALAQLLSESGMMAPFRSGRLQRASGLYVSLIEPTAADQREGRLGAELLRIRSMFERSRPDALIILDELCSGTNPSEGEEIFRLVIDLLAELRPRVLITTHFLQFAQALSSDTTLADHLRFLQVILDKQDQPTYRFRPGVASTSLAHLTASRLGVTREELRSLIRHNSVAGVSGDPSRKGTSS